MHRQLRTFLLLVIVLASGCATRKPDNFIDTVHGYLRCNTGLRDVDKTMLAISHEYGFQHLHSKYQGIGHEDNHKVLYGYNTTSYSVPEDKTLTLETVAEKGQPLHVKFKMDTGGLYSREEIMIEIARRIGVLPNAKALEVKHSLPSTKTETKENL